MTIVTRCMTYRYVFTIWSAHPWAMPWNRKRPHLPFYVERFLEVM